ncbi:MAG: hypothetical protein NTU47_09710 [Ignavibacteriales bacterium]|nr:hypothetical protein [Ignavibacteriales bacterium]
MTTKAEVLSLPILFSEFAQARGVRNNNDLGFSTAWNAGDERRGEQPIRGNFERANRVESAIGDEMPHACFPK